MRGEGRICMNIDHAYMWRKSTAQAIMITGRGMNIDHAYIGRITYRYDRIAEASSKA